ncbi:MAG TPA: GntR family transcriptional regulator [Bosea sp. (in: a-proteobacteria)]|jgi:DNA-binding GntR family transcriptional regulator|uniref:GntR family transcriptional regulator n=1 Tax=Bosea sp. (in: a-proteobacteria) TaxID=1871050 RepID=UPI002E0E9227|nr:GntR family transcriptional regulator [Bosea sp. (in: a-proteobacteria)]
MSTTLKHRTLSSAIVDQLRQAILDGTYPAGSQLRQDALAQAYAVSRIPVREALFQLEAEGFVKIVPHKGAIVSGLSLDEINDVFELRKLLEPRLLASSIPAMTAADFEAVAGMEAAFEAAMSAGDISRWGLLNADFRMALYARATQPRTLSIVSGLLQTSDRYTRLQLQRGSSIERAQAEHNELIQLCRGGELGEAERLLVDHIELVRRDLVEFLEAGGKG